MPSGEVDAHPQAGWNPYRSTSLLWRIHGVSILLVVPQFAVSTFGLVWLVTELRLPGARRPGS